jgi:hypothetical protein
MLLSLEVASGTNHSPDQITQCERLANTRYFTTRRGIRSLFWVSLCKSIAKVKSYDRLPLGDSCLHFPTPNWPVWLLGRFVLP